jgi:hypothetical protein
MNEAYFQVRSLLMSKNQVNEVTISLKTVDQLFIAPDVNPFAEDEVELLGEPALMRVLKKTEPGFFRRGHKLRLTVLLPSEQITSDLSTQVDAALQRYCQARIADNRLQIRRTIWTGVRAAPFGLTFLGVSMGLSAIFGSQILAAIPDWLNSLLAEGFVVIGWIALWNPVGAFLYDWVPFWRANQVLQHMMTMEIRFQPQPAG